MVHCFVTREPLFIESREGPDGCGARFPFVDAIWEKLGLSSAVFLPLLVLSEPVGVISFGFPNAHVFSDSERRFFESLGHAVAIALYRSRLFHAESAARREAEAANRAKSDFLATMSHELRTPLNAIGGYTELLEMGVRGPVTFEQRQDLERIQRAQRHLLGLINGVLNYAKLDAGAVAYAVEDVVVREMLAVCEALVAPQASRKGLTLRVDAYAGRSHARADREKVQQVLLNLLSNAIKFTDVGGSIVMDAIEDEEHIVFRVSDTGVGIAAEQLERVFQPFTQVDSRYTRTQVGTGLGLAISRDLATGMGGSLSVTSTLGEGSVFALTLPL